MSKARPIYSFPDFKEPEKTTSWDPPKDVKVDLEDPELKKAKRRSALIKERMGPPGALKLPPLLEAARLKYGIPDGAFKSQASFDRIYVWPIEMFDGEATFRGTSIIKPMLSQRKDMQEGHRGVLISAGLIALDHLKSHGIELGHIVSTNKNVPFARRCEQLEAEDMFYLVMRDADLAGSETLAQELLEGTKVVVENDGTHHIAGRLKQKVQIEDNW